MRHFVWVELSHCKVGLRFDPKKLESSVQVAFPFGVRHLTATDLAELGAILVSLAADETSTRLSQILADLGLESTQDLRTTRTADEVAKRIVDAFCSGCPQLRDMLSVDGRRAETIGVLAQQLARINQEREDRREQNVSDGT